VSFRSLSRSEAAFSNSWFSIAASFSVRTFSISSSSSRYRGGAVIVLIRMRDAASSTRSIALSGRCRSWMYRSASDAAASSASSVILQRWCAS
jgi:hypothetical protein